jgi:hypothetical protein
VNEYGKIPLFLDGRCGIRLVGEDGRPKASLGFLTTGQLALMFFRGPVPREDLRLAEQGDPASALVGTRN